MSKNGLNIYKRKDGRWEGRFADGIKANGKTKYHSIYGHSYEEVEKKMSIVYSNQCVYIEKTDLTVKKLFVEWISAISPSVKESTIANYRMKAEKHILPTFGEQCCIEVNANQVYAFIHQKMSSGLSTRYVTDIVILLKSIFKYASREYDLYNPLTNLILPKKKKNAIQILDNANQEKLKKYIKTTQNRVTLGIAISMYTGVRIGELCALQWKDIDFEKRILAVNQTIQRIQDEEGIQKTKLVITEPKSLSSQREIPIPTCLISMLKEFQSNPDYYVLSGSKKPVEPRNMQYHFRKILKKINLPLVHFHSLRHMFATNCIALGFDAKSLSEILGHSSVEITLNRYVHSSMEQKSEYMERFSFNV